MDEIAGVVARAGLVGAGLIGGTFFAFSAFIMAALGRLSAEAGIRSMQSINRAVYTPWFMVPFFGTVLLSIGAVGIGLIGDHVAHPVALVSGGVLYTLGVFAVTAAGNVPLNTRLEKVDAASAPAPEQWRHYLVVWTRWNHVRTIASIGSILAFGIAA